ncbi:unnamed protein product [Mytilus edulis]|uniref:Uncharacterized protein n=1 Tax=Mytilus edulis TaxID=6550 RepID=A0A8S3T466_MYTED|nr:unnamed protein product [Mytilus edulis]
MKKRKKDIMSTMYNRSKVHITEKLIREKEIIEHLEISQLHESKDQESLKEIERKQNLRRGLTHVSDKCTDFFYRTGHEAYNMKGFKSVSTKKGIAEMLRHVILSNESMLNFEAVFELQEASTSAQQHVEETNPLSESVDHLEEEQSEQVSEITNQSGATSDREEEGGQSKCKQSSKRRNTRERKSMGTKKGRERSAKDLLNGHVEYVPKMPVKIL